MSSKTDTDSNIDMDIFAKSTPWSSYQEDFNSGPKMDAKVESECILSSHSQVKDNSALKSETSFKAKFK